MAEYRTSCSVSRDLDQQLRTVAIQRSMRILDVIRECVEASLWATDLLQPLEIAAHRAPSKPTTLAVAMPKEHHRALRKRYPNGPFSPVMSAILVKYLGAALTVPITIRLKAEVWTELSRRADDMDVLTETLIASLIEQHM